MMICAVYQNLKHVVEEDVLPTVILLQKILKKLFSFWKIVIGKSNLKVQYLI